MPASKATISAKQRVSLIKSRFLKETKSPNGKVLSTSSAKKRETSAKYNNGGRLHDLLDKAKQLKPAGIYGRIFEGNEQEILFEIAIQANSSPGEKRGAIRATSPEFVEIAQQLYPNAKVGDTYYPVVYKEGGEIEMNERRSEIKGYDVFKKIERNGGYIKTSEVEIDDDYDSDDVEHKRTLAYRVEYRVEWMDLESSSDADTEIFETIDKAYEDAQMPGHWWNGDVDHIKIIQPLFYEVWLNSDDSEYEDVKTLVGEDLLYNREKGSDEAAAQLGLKASDLNEIYVKDFGSRDEDAHELEDEVYDNLGGDLEKSFTAPNGQTYKIQHTGNSKYSRLNIVDKDGYIIDSVQLRISNHKYNPANNDRDAKAGKFISVEIANKNPTAARFSTQYSLGFYGRDTYDEVLEKVKERLDDILETLIDYPEHEQTMKHGGNINDHIMTHVAAGGLGEAIGGLAFLEKGGAIEKTIALPDSYSDYPSLKKILQNQGYDLKKNETMPLKDRISATKSKYAQGGHVKADGKPTNDAKKGGFFDGKSHAEGGIKAINVDTNEPIEVEGNEVIINKKSVADKTLHDFNGKKMTNKEILSEINKAGGGVAFEEGGEVSPEPIIREDEKQIKYSSLSGKAYETGGIVDETTLTDTEIHILSKLDHSTRSKCEIDKSKLSEIEGIKQAGIVYVVPLHSNCYEVMLTDYGAAVTKGLNLSYDSTKFATGGEMDCGCGHVKFQNGGPVTEDSEKKYFQGIDHKYNNQFEVNKAIEEFVQSKKSSEFSPAEKAFIGYYAGYGGLVKFGATGKGLLYEYFTPSDIAKKMWGLAYKYGYKGGKVLEPSCGIGEFIKYAPTQALVTGYEINKISAKICSILYPDARIESKYFEQIFIKNNSSIRGNIQSTEKYALVIGNPPYGKMDSLYSGMGEKSYTKANNYIEYFILRGLDLLEKDGLLIFIIGTEVAAGGIPLLQQGLTPVKKTIAEKAELIDAYRLPNGLFETTDVLTDIIVLKKK